MKKILLVCNAGMSSSILINKIKQAAEGRNIEVKVEASSNNGINDEIGKWDVCLVGPQIKYAVDSIQVTLKIPVEAVEPRTYAMADGEAALEQALRLYEKKDV
ncbi:PTS sugar transporter subunit IIB [Caldifermentibacillus hisashii]|uniref:PTS sugar transporter subunit IIB n=1 Tax=Caldifermentibacillus hisashii TaxID=996558 RepID=UPI003D23C1FA